LSVVSYVEAAIKKKKKKRRALSTHNGYEKREGS